jgi:hypothetical protein
LLCSVASDLIPKCKNDLPDDPSERERAGGGDGEGIGRRSTKAGSAEIYGNSVIDSASKGASGRGHREGSTRHSTGSGGRGRRPPEASCETSRNRECSKEAFSLLVRAACFDR